MLQIPARECVDLATERCRLAPLGLSDAGELRDVVHASRAFLERWLSLFALLEKPADFERYGEECERWWQAGVSVRLAVRAREGGQLLGVVSLDQINPANLSASWGVWLRQDAAGRGLGKEASRALLRWGFRTLGVRRITADPRVDNAASLRMVRGLGFREEGIARAAEFIDGRWHDHVVCALLATDPEAP